MPVPRKSDCGVCGDLKVERRGRLVCPACSRRYAREALLRNGPRPITDAVRAAKRRYGVRVRSSGLTNNKALGLRLRYGITEKQYLALRESQANRCAICEADISGARKTCIDHDHSTKRVRGLLCLACNFAIGLLKECPKRFEAAVAYLARSAT